jgi:hypothetical protein
MKLKLLLILSFISNYWNSLNPNWLYKEKYFILISLSNFDPNMCDFGTKLLAQLVSIFSKYRKLNNNARLQHAVNTKRNGNCRLRMSKC